VNGSLIAEAGKLRYPREFRIELFRTIVDGIRRCDKKVQIALCKETPQVWRERGCFATAPVDGWWDCDCGKKGGRAGCFLKEINLDRKCTKRDTHKSTD